MKTSRHIQVLHQAQCILETGSRELLGIQGTSSHLCWRVGGTENTYGTFEHDLSRTVETWIYKSLWCYRYLDRPAKFNTYPKTMQRGVIAFLCHGFQGKFSSKFSGLAQITIHVHKDLKAITTTQKIQFMVWLVSLCWLGKNNKIKLLPVALASCRVLYSLSRNAWFVVWHRDFCLNHIKGWDSNKEIYKKRSKIFGRSSDISWRFRRRSGLLRKCW